MQSSLHLLISRCCNICSTSIDLSSNILSSSCATNSHIWHGSEACANKIRVITRTFLPADGLVDENIAIAARVLVFSGLSNRTQSRQRLAIAATFLRRCAAQALTRGNGSRHCLHASPNNVNNIYDEYETKTTVDMQKLKYENKMY